MNITTIAAGLANMNSEKLARPCPGESELDEFLLNVFLVQDKVDQRQQCQTYKGPLKQKYDKHNAIKEHIFIFLGQPPYPFDGGLIRVTSNSELWRECVHY
jgi:hypothetical protein